MVNRIVWTAGVGATLGSWRVAGSTKGRGQCMEHGLLAGVGAAARGRGRSRAAPGGSLRGPGTRGLDRPDVRRDTAVLGQARVPPGEERHEIMRVVPALGQADGLAGVRGDPVLVTRDVPRDREDDLAVGSR